MRDEREQVTKPQGRRAHKNSEAQALAAPPSGEGGGGAHHGLDLHHACEPADLFRLTYRLIEDIQRVRLAHGNRIRQVLPLIPAHVQPPRGTPSWESFFKQSADVFEHEESRVLNLANRLLRDDPVGRWMLSQQGIGPSLAVSILGECWPLSRFANPQKLWAYAGLHVKDGKGVKRAKGQKANWNARLKTRCWLFSQSILKAGGPWRDLYDERKRYEYEKLGMVFEKVGAQLTTGAQVQCAPGLPESVGARVTCDSHTSDAPDRDVEARAHSLRDAHILVAPSLDANGGAHGSADAPDCSVPAVPESGDAHFTIDSQLSHPLSRLHLHNRALRFVMKRLLRDLWVIAHPAAP